MTFVNDSESLWELIAIEQDLENLGMHANFGDGLSWTPVLMKAYDAYEAATGDQQSRDLLLMLHRDQFELEKLILKRDQEILNRCIRFDSNGVMTVFQSPLTYMSRTNQENNSSSSHERRSINSHQPSQAKKLVQKSIFVKEPKVLSDAYFETKLQQQRLKMSMRRNILRRTLSEDLQWGDCIKNDPSYKPSNRKFRVLPSTTRSLRATPERRLISLSPPSPKNGHRFRNSEIKLQVGKNKLHEGTPKKRKRRSHRKKKYFTNQITLQNKANDRKQQSDFLNDSNQDKLGANDSKGKNFRDARELRNSIIESDFSQSHFSNFQQKSLAFDKESANKFTSSLNQQSLEQLGPVQKMAFNGLYFSHKDLQISTSYLGQASQTGSGQHSPIENDHHYNTQLLQMNQLIMNSKPIASKQVSALFSSTNLSKNAQLYLYPIREQKLLFMNKDKKNGFAEVKIHLRINEVKQQLQITPKVKVDAVESCVVTQAKPKEEKEKPHKTTPKKEGKEEKKELKVGSTIVKKGANKKVEVLSGQHQMHLGEDCKDFEDVQSEIVVQEEDSKQIIEFLIKYVLVGYQKEIRQNDSQKSILLDFPESSRVIDFLELNELSFNYCRLCECLICDTTDKFSDAIKASIDAHYQSKSHLRTREDNNIREMEDLCFSMLQLVSSPGDIADEVKREKEKALKRSAARLKKQIQECSVQHENASTYPGKELQSTHKKRLQIRYIELEKSVFPQIQNYDTVEAILNDVIKVMDLKKIADLHLMRKLKFIPTLIDICKRISMCPRQELKHLGKALGLVIKIVQQFCSLRENRNYMLQTNRLMPLIELFNWCLNRSTEIFFGIDFLPNLFNILTSHLRHRVPFECQQLKELTVDYLISSTITAKLKSKHAIIKQIPPTQLQESMGQIPFFLLKSTTFLEALTAMISIDARTRPVYEKSYKIGEHVFFVLQQTELFGIIQMITTLLLTCNETFKTSGHQPALTMILPQTVLSLAIVSVKALNNILRTDFRQVHQLMASQDEQLYFLLNFLLWYAEANIEQSDDVKELLHETLLFIGYFSLLNTENQNLLQRGENCIIKKLCNLPFAYFFEKRPKEILFPTLICATFQNERSLAIVDQEMDLSTLVKYLETNIEEELPKIIELEQEQFSEHTKSLGSFGREQKSGRALSPSASSVSSNSAQSVCMDFLSGNNPYLPLTMRFPKRYFREAARGLKKD